MEYALSNFIGLYSYVVKGYFIYMVYYFLNSYFCILKVVQNCRFFGAYPSWNKKSPTCICADAPALLFNIKGRVDYYYPEDTP
ncbi:MAG: hypothetical protein NTX03_13395 [Bacteroidetes bacterium]|nr:hypothetical protein [Bacteroidota bacterium]